MSEGTWVDIELEALTLPDVRLEKRSNKLLNQLSCNPQDSIPVACRGAAETKAAYRLFGHSEVKPDQILEAHKTATLKRMSKHEVVLIPQDTTVLNFTGQPMRTDTGPTVSENSLGIYCHASIAVTPNKVCLGVLSVTQWKRDKLQRVSRKERSKRDRGIPIEEKESYRWLEHCAEANDYAKQLPETQIISVADREGDIYELYDRAQRLWTAPNAHYLIRCHYDRCVCTEEGNKTNESFKTNLKKEPKLGEFIVRIPKTNKRKERSAKLALYAKRVTIARSKGNNHSPNSLPYTSVSVIYCFEKNPPKNSDKIEWLLVTDLAVESFEKAFEKVQWYCCRWQIECFFKTLKSGCAIEKLQLDGKRFQVCFAFYLIIAWRILYLTMLSRNQPDCSCELVFSKEEWQTTYVVLYKKVPPKQAPSLVVMTKMVASLGGYLNRKSDPAPGIKTLWLGMRAMQEHLKAREAFELTFGKQLMGND